MFFDKKIKCERCKSGISKDFSFCPYCGLSLIDAEREMRDFGMLGRSDHIQNQQPASPPTITDHLIGSMMDSLVKSLDRQFREAAKSQSQGKTEIKSIPNGISIRIGPAMSQAQKKSPSQVTRKVITEEQIKKMSSLPRTAAKSKIRRLSDRVIYEMAAPGIESPKDIIISKLESGYEIKAIGKDKVFVNSVPLELPIHGFSFDSEKLFVEFLHQSQ